MIYDSRRFVRNRRIEETCILFQKIITPVCHKDTHEQKILITTRREVLNHSTKCFKCIEEAHCYETHVVLPAKKKKKERKKKKTLTRAFNARFIRLRE